MEPGSYENETNDLTVMSAAGGELDLTIDILSIKPSQEVVP